MTCHYSRNFGAGKINAQLSADAHLRRLPHHVIIRYEMNVAEIFKRDDHQLAVPVGDEPPF